MPKYTLGPDVDLNQEVVRDKRGKRITEAYAKRLIDSTPIPRVGRPALGSPGQRSPEVKARVPLKTKQKLERVAKKRNMTPSELLRELLEEYLKSA